MTELGYKLTNTHFVGVEGDVVYERIDEQYIAIVDYKQKSKRNHHSVLHTYDSDLIITIKNTFYSKFSARTSE